MTRWTPFIPGAVIIVVLPVLLALNGQSRYPWRLAWLIPLCLAGYAVIVGLLLRLKP